MNQNPQVTTVSLTQNDVDQKPLQTVVNVALKYQGRFKATNTFNKNYEVLYKDIKQVLSQLDDSIVDCKIYNEAKTRRKYERKIQELQNELKMLNQKVKQLSRTRSPSKRYIEDLVDKLVLYKNQNQKLLAQNEHLIREKQMKEQKSFNHLKQDSEMQSFDKLNQSHLGSSQLIRQKSKGKQFNLKQEISTFLRQKQIQKKVLNLQQSKLQHFFQLNLKKLGESSFGQFLRHIDNLFQNNFMNFLINSQKIPKPDKVNFASFLQQSNLKKLPKITHVPSSSSKNLQHSYRNAKSYRKNKNEQKWKGSINYSTLQVLGRVNQKVMLK